MIDLSPLDWHAEAWSFFLERKARGSLPHAYIYFGLSGLGKLFFARSVANTLLCTHNQSGGCGVCASCRWFEASNHPNYFEITPSRADACITVEQIRHVNHALSLSTGHLNWRVVVFDPADALHESACHALLKTLEEPPEWVLFILITPQRHRISAAIQSRAQAVAFLPPPVSIGLAWLKKKFPHHSTDVLQTILSLHHGAPMRISPSTLIRDQKMTETIVRALTDPQYTITWSSVLKSVSDVHSMLCTWFLIALDILKYRMGIVHSMYWISDVRRVSHTDANSVCDWITEELCRALNPEWYARANPILLAEHLLFQWNKRMHK